MKKKKSRFKESKFKNRIFDECDVLEKFKKDNPDIQLTERDINAMKIYGTTFDNLGTDAKCLVDNFIYDINNPKWRNVVVNGTECPYEISNTGLVRNAFSKKLMKCNYSTDKYLRASLSLDSKTKTIGVHRLVAQAFIPNPENKPQVNHIIPIKSFNWVGNLEWATASENITHAIDHELLPIYLEEDSNSSIYKNYQIHEVCKLLKERKLSRRKISEITGVNIETISAVAKKREWVSISDKYDLGDDSRYWLGIDSPQCIYTEDQIHKVCSMLEDENIPYHKISQATGVKEYIISQIRQGKTWRHISSKYNIRHRTNKTRKGAGMELNKQFVDDTFIHLKSDIDKLRIRPRMYVAASGCDAAKNIVLEILYNALDEIKNPRSPGNRIDILFDENTDTIEVQDNGRGIPIGIFENILTTLNSGSNIDSTSKADLKTNILGTNGVGTLATTALGRITDVTTYRGGTEDKFLRLVFEEGKKVKEESGNCDSSKHGMRVIFSPSKVLGKNTHIIWKDIKQELINLQFLESKKYKMTSKYINKKGDVEDNVYTVKPFEDMLTLRTDKNDIISDRVRLSFEDDSIEEEISGKKSKRYLSMDIAFMYTNSLNPYIDSFSNGNNTIDNGSHLDGVLEGICRYLQNATKNSLSERDNLDIKWDDVKNGLALIVSLNTNLEELYTSQTKHKVSNDELEKIIKDKTILALTKYFEKNQAKGRELINIVKLNAKARREGEKAKNSVVKETMTNWSSFKMRNYTPCINKGKEYKELYICEGLSAKGTLAVARDPKTQAIFALRGIVLNALDRDLATILQNKEFNDLIKILGCNVGAKFDLSKLAFNRIILSSDADENLRWL